MRLKKVYYNNERELAGLKWVAKVVDFGVGLLVASAINEMYNAYTYLVERKDIMKGKTKKYCNQAFKEAKITDVLIKDIMRDKQFWMDYSDAVIDLAAHDITLFRFSIKQTLDNEKIKESLMFSYVETTRVLLEMAVIQYQNVMEQAKKKFGRNYTKDFKEFKLDKAFYWWTKFSDEIYTGSHFNMNNEKTEEMYDIMCQKFAEGKYIQGCLKVANENNPSFIKNEIKES